jgi:hypothetical protein
VKASHRATRTPRESGEEGLHLASNEGVSNNSDPAPNYYPNLSKTFSDIGPPVAALSGSEGDLGFLSTSVMAEIRVCEVSTLLPHLYSDPRPFLPPFSLESYIVFEAYLGKAQLFVSRC